MDNVQVYLEDGCVIFKVTPTFDYDIPFDEIKGQGIDWWLNHLREKVWWNTHLEGRFVNLLEDINHGK